MKPVLACTATVVLTALLATTAIPAMAAITPPNSAPPIAAGTGAAAKDVPSGAGSTDGIRDEFAKLRCLFFRC